MNGNSHSDDNVEEPLIDPDLKDELKDIPAEDPFVTEYMTGGGGSKENVLRFIEKWFPQEDDWQGKTSIAPHQAHALAMARNMPDHFEELEPLAPFLDNAIGDYEKYLTSIDGEARRQHVDILRTLFGGPETDESEARSSMLAAFAQNMNEEE